MSKIGVCGLWVVILSFTRCALWVSWRQTNNCPSVHGNRLAFFFFPPLRPFLLFRFLSSPLVAATMASWEHFGEVANVIQLTGLNAVALIGLIAKAANTARMHKKNCRQFSQHVKLIGNLLEQLKITELKRYPETREPLEQLEDSLRRAYLLVNSCQERSYLYLMAMGWNIVYQFRRAQEEIDRYLRIIPLIALIDNARVKIVNDEVKKVNGALKILEMLQVVFMVERLEEIERDQREYTLDDDDRKVQDALSQNDMIILKKSLSCSYGNVPVDKALRKERKKLELELQHSQANMDVSQCQVIERLMEVTEYAATTPGQEHDMPCKASYTSDSDKEHFSSEKNCEKIDNSKCSSREVKKSSSYDTASTKELTGRDEWHADLLGCCSEPYLYKDFRLSLRYAFEDSICGNWQGNMYSRVFNTTASAQTCNDIMAYSLILSCCCYTCCLRGKLRRTLNIKGGCFDDFLSHLMCCCCALVQEWREVELRVPLSLYMNIYFSLKHEF
ncbi:PLAC8 family protein [Striga asiatica]|uniref:PLAC8 family protein n=1 Tax=Striga asiatica TaxID=4170 RepID=A0A5A7Q6H1_STRAF|nr:PLAC8 family protein [Striga asiatica]